MLSPRLRFCILALVLLVVLSGSLSAGPMIKLKSGDFDPLNAARPTDATVAAAFGSRYQLVQFTGPIHPEWRESLKTAGAKIIGYIPDFAYLVAVDEGAAPNLAGLPSVRWVGPYESSYKYMPSLAAIPGPKVITTTMLVFAGADIAVVKKGLEAAGATVLAQSASPKQTTLRVRCAAGVVPLIADLADVEWIEQYVAPKLTNNVARTITKVENAWTDNHLYGEGQIVCVADTGLDTGNDATVSADFAGRILKTYALAHQDDWSDGHGHGTHTCGTVLGNGSSSGSDPATHDYSDSFAGVAPEAQLVMQSIGNDGILSGLPVDLQELLGPPYTDGARVHSDSWGASVYGLYDTSAMFVDLFMWDYKDMVMVVAAGNDGTDSNNDGVIDWGCIGSPATSKNAITVGASESLRDTGGISEYTWGGGWPSDYPALPIRSDYTSDNASGMAAFSSRGACADWRIKPDIVAPGTNIVSARSHLAAGEGWGIYDENYEYMGGSSMACPHVAGAAALVREFFLDEGWESVSSAMVKATLINGAADMTPGQYGSDPATREIIGQPDFSQGFGRLDMTKALSAANVAGDGFMDFQDETDGLVTNSAMMYEYTLEEGDSARFTLVWTDAPGQPESGPSLVNDLDLYVFDPDMNYLAPNGLGTWDGVNNVEDVFIPNGLGKAGTYTVVVDGYNVPSDDPQPYALVVRITPSLPDFETSTKTSSESTSVLPGSTITYTITASNTGARSQNTVITDSIPEHTTYVAGSTKLNGNAVLDVNGDCPLVAGLTVNSDGAESGIVARNAAAVVMFDVTVDNDIGEAVTIQNTARITADHGVDLERTVTNRSRAYFRIKVGGTGDGIGSWDNAAGSMDVVFNNIIEADQVWVARGTYACNVTVLDQVKFLGGFAGDETSADQRNPAVNVTILDGGLRGSVVNVAEGAGQSTLIDGLTIRKGTGTRLSIGSGSFVCGGGVFASHASPTITRDVFASNTAGQLGGAIYCTGDEPVIQDNVFTGNSANGIGLTGYGGAIYCTTSGTVINRNTFTSNRATGNGGAIYCAGSASPSITQNAMIGNGANYGGAIYIADAANPLVANCKMTANAATWGGAIYVGNGSTATLTNNTIAHNTASVGGGIGIHSGSPLIRNNIVAFNSTGLFKNGTGTATLRNNCVARNIQGDYAGLTPGAGSIAVDPLFSNAGAGDYREGPGSPCINAGLDSCADSAWCDLDGRVRKQGAHVDIGAYEKTPTVPNSVSLTPNSGALATAPAKLTLVSKYSDVEGYTNIANCYLLLNTALTGANGAYVRYDANANKLYVRNDAGNAWLGGYAPGSANVIQNNSCILYCKDTSISGLLTALTVNWSLQLKDRLTGKTVPAWMTVFDDTGLSTDWKKVGTFVTSRQPTSVSIAPNSGTIMVGNQFTLNARFADGDGNGDIAECYVLFSQSSSAGANAAYLYYNAQTNKLYVKSDQNITWLGGFAPGSANVIQNSFCKLYCAGTTVSRSGNGLVVNFRLEFKPTMGGRHSPAWMCVTDKHGLRDAWVQAGTLSISRQPTNVSLSPASGTLAAGTKITMISKYSDSDGFPNLAACQLGFGYASADLARVKYDQNTNKLYIKKNAQNEWSGGFAPGVSNVIENDALKLYCEETTVSGLGTNFAINWKIEFKLNMRGSTLPGWLTVSDDANLSDPPETMGTYAIR